MNGRMPVKVAAMADRMTHFSRLSPRALFWVLALGSLAFSRILTTVESLAVGAITATRWGTRRAASPRPSASGNPCPKGPRGNRRA